LALIPGIGLKVSPEDRGDIESLTGFDLKVKVVVPTLPAPSVDSKTLIKKTGQTGNINSNNSWNSRNVSMNLKSFVSKSATCQNKRKEVIQTNRESIDVRTWK
jgi:hypothetical protein